MKTSNEKRISGIISEAEERLIQGQINYSILQLSKFNKENSALNSKVKILSRSNKFNKAGLILLGLVLLYTAYNLRIVIIQSERYKEELIYKDIRIESLRRLNTKFDRSLTILEDRIPRSKELKKEYSSLSSDLEKAVSEGKWDLSVEIRQDFQQLPIKYGLTKFEKSIENEIKILRDSGDTLDGSLEELESRKRSIGNISRNF